MSREAEIIIRRNRQGFYFRAVQSTLIKPEVQPTPSIGKRDTWLSKTASLQLACSAFKGFQILPFMAQLREKLLFELEWQAIFGPNLERLLTYIFRQIFFIVELVILRYRLGGSFLTFEGASNRQSVVASEILQIMRGRLENYEDKEIKGRKRERKRSKGLLCLGRL